ncbi:uncharacterized protein LODBEIA_P06610 [Lodderomyces beijingensis]|uniref:Uncharacterized protein n=1 Tax=Lodderomyces beijingensis TaxID=1775926 RepID=A0ABP0ZJT5_9ASCO
MSHSQITNANNYTLRDTLLISQLLYINHIATLEDLEKIDPSLLESILNEWKTHISTRLEQKTIKINTLNQMKDLYKNMLKKYKADTTETLANQVYFLRMSELEQTITQKKSEFQAILNEDD